MNQYKVKSLDKTSTIEKNFNYEYHKKYIGQVGTIINHWFTQEPFNHFACLKFSETDRDWIHLSDLERISKEI